MAVKKTVPQAKLISIWTKSPEQVEEASLKLKLDAARISANTDLLLAETDLNEMQTELVSLKEVYNEALSRWGKDWSPAVIVNARMMQKALEDSIKDFKVKIELMRNLMEEYL